MASSAAVEGPCSSIERATRCRVGAFGSVSGDDGLVPYLDWATPTMGDTLGATLQDLLTASEVPAANEIQCGWGAHHDLEGAQAAARAFLDQRAEWAQVTAS